MEQNKILKTNEDIKKELKKLAKKINRDFKNSDCLEIICFTNGATFFCSDLSRLLKIPININFFGFSSYEELPKSGEVKIEQDLKKFHLSKRCPFIGRAYNKRKNSYVSL